VKTVAITGRADALEAVKATVDDIQRMLQIDEVEFLEGTVEIGPVSVKTIIAE
jgi:hypothetical protein